MWVDKGYQQLASLGSAQSLTVPAGSRFALLVAEVANVRIRSDGTAPTATVGLLLKATDPPLLFDGPLSALEAIAASAGAILNVNYFGQE